eukprot:g36241.t1
MDCSTEPGFEFILEFVYECIVKLIGKLIVKHNFEHNFEHNFKFVLELDIELINMSLREVKGVDLEEEDLTRYSKMNAWCAKVLEQNNLQGRRSQVMMAEERKATPDILLQNAARVGLLTACKVLTTSDEFDLDKAAARKAGEGSSDPATQEYFATYGFELYLGRYRRAPEPAYESPTCSVWMAEDMKAENAQDAKIALKVIKAGVPGAQDNFEREVHSRNKLGSLPGLVLPLIRTYKDELCLVMPAGDYSLAEFLRRRDIPGRDVKKVQEIVLQIIACLEKLHARQLVHGDIKPNNIISIGNNKFVLIDFDAAVEFGKPVGVKYSTSYCEPQLATVVARRQVQGKDHLQGNELVCNVKLWRESRSAAQWVMSVVGELEAMVFRPKAERAYELTFSFRLMLTQTAPAVVSVVCLCCTQSLAMCDELVRRLVSPFKRLEPLTDEQVAASEAKERAERAERAASPVGQPSLPVQDVAPTASVEELRALLQAAAEREAAAAEREAGLRVEIERLRASQQQP